MKTILLVVLMLSGITFLHAQVTNKGNLMIHSGASVAVSGDFVNNGAFTDSGQVFLLNGSAIQTLSGTAATTFCNLKLSNSSGAQLSRNVSITKTLMLESGGFDLNKNTLTILNGQSTAIGRTSGYLISEQTDNSSMVSWQINSSPGVHIIPLGTATGTYIPFEITVSSGDIGTFSLSTYPTGLNNTPLPLTPVSVTHLNDSNNIDNSLNVVDRFWYLNKSGAGGATITFNASAAEIGTISGLVAQKWNETTQGWENPLPGQSATATSATVPSVSNFGVWVLSATASPLPVELLSFIAEENSDKVLLKWITASEIQSHYFVVEKTTDFIHFIEVAKVAAAGNSNEILQYSATDNNPFSGESYYRLRQVDFDGQEHFSQYEAVAFGEFAQLSAVVYPVPARAGDINIRLNNVSGETLYVEMNDFTGRCEYKKALAITGPVMDIKLPETENLGAGGKMLQITTSDGVAVYNKILISAD